MVDLASQNCPARGEEIKSILLRIQHTECMTHMDSLVARHSENGPSSHIVPPFTLCVRDSLPGWGVYEDLVLRPYGAFTGDCRPAAVMSVWSFINVTKANDEEIQDTEPDLLWFCEGNKCMIFQVNSEQEKNIGILNSNHKWVIWKALHRQQCCASHDQLFEALRIDFCTSNMRGTNTQ